MSRKKTSLVIDSAYHTAVKVYCIENNIDMSDYFEDLIKKDKRINIAHYVKEEKKAA